MVANPIYQNWIIHTIDHFIYLKSIYIIDFEPSIFLLYSELFSN